MKHMWTAKRYHVDECMRRVWKWHKSIVKADSPWVSSVCLVFLAIPLSVSLCLTLSHFVSLCLTLSHFVSLCLTLSHLVSLLFSLFVFLLLSLFLSLSLQVSLWVSLSLFVPLSVSVSPSPRVYLSLRLSVLPSLLGYHCLHIDIYSNHLYL